jgi:hypothetical protein
VTRRDRILLHLLLVVAVAAGVWLVVLAPRRDEARRLDGRIAATAVDLRRLEALAAAARAGAAADVRPTMAELDRAIPPTVAMPTLLRQMEGGARRHHVAIELVSVAAADSAAAAAAAPATTPATSDSVATTTLTLSLRGRFADLRRLLAGMQRDVRLSGDGVTVAGRLVSVGALDLTRDDSAVTAKAQVSVFALPPGSAGASEAKP